MQNDLQQKINRIKFLLSNPILDFNPTPKQLQFLKSNHKRRLIRAANRTGKTEVASVEALCLAIRESPWKELDKKPTTGLIVSSDWKQTKDVIGKKLWDRVPKQLLKEGSDWNPNRGWKNSIMEFKNGSIILFRSGEANTTSIAGLTVDWVLIDEPCPQHLYGEIVARVATSGGPIFLSMTPIGKDLKWLRDIVEGDELRNIPPQEEWEQYNIQLTTEDCPHRTQESIDNQISSVGRWEYEQRILGAWESMSVNRCFEGLTESSIQAELPKRNYNVAFGIDHGELAGKEVCILGLYTKDGIIIYDEYISSSISIPEQDAEQIKLMLHKNNLTTKDISIAWGDINSAGKSASSVKINALLGNALNINIERPNKKPGSIDYGIKLLNAALKRGHIKIHPRCSNLILALKTWDGSNNKAKDKIDAFRYLCVGLLEKEIYNKETMDRILIGL